MTSPNHSMQSAIIAHTIYPEIWFIVLAFILGWMNDIEIWHQTLTGKKRDYTKFYQFAHYSYWTLLIPFMNLHFLMDKIIHKPEGGTNKLYYPLEVLTWLIILGYLCKNYTSLLSYF